MGLTGDLYVSYYSNGKLEDASWECDLQKDESRSKYERQINRIVKRYTKKYGVPITGYSDWDYQWKDMYGGIIRIIIDLDHYSFMLWYDSD